MLSVHADGENRYRLEHATGESIGWIRGRAIGIIGLRTERDALRAAVTGARAMQAALRRQYPGWPQHEPAYDALRLVHDGAYEWVSDGLTPVARLVRLAPARSFEGPFGLEFVLPSFASEGVAMVVAQALGSALLPHLALEPAANADVPRTAAALQPVHEGGLPSRASAVPA